jgi:hypothetical protein
MPIRFYTTDIEAEKTAREIQEILGSSGARRVAMSYDADGHPTEVQFVLLVGKQPLPFRVEPDVDGMRKALNDDDDTPGNFETEQARRTAWRIWKEWINSVLAFQKTQQAGLDQLLLGFGVTEDGRSVHERLLSDRKLLDSPQGRRGEHRS